MAEDWLKKKKELEKRMLKVLKESGPLKPLDLWAIISMQYVKHLEIVYLKDIVPRYILQGTMVRLIDKGILK